MNLFYFRVAIFYNMINMTIGIDIRALISRQLTGVGIYTWEILNHLFALDQKNKYKLFYNSARGLSSKVKEQFSSYQNVKLFSFKYPNKLLNASLFFLNSPKIDKMIGGCDLFWFPNLNFWSISKNCRSIITVHDLSFKRIPWAYSEKRRLWHKLVKPQDKLRRADKIIAVSENTKNDLIDIYGLAEDKVGVVHPGVEIRNPTCLCEAEASLRRRQVSEIRNPNFELPERFILFLGTLEPRKNVEGVIQAFEKVNQKDLHLVIAGGQGWLYQKIYRMARRSKNKDRIVFLDYINPEERWVLYQKAQLLVWPSFYEGFGFPPLEAMSQGCPVITSANSSLPEVVGEASFLVDPYNIEEISQAINIVLNDSQLRQRLIEKGYEQVKKFSWQDSAKKILKLFEEPNP